MSLPSLQRRSGRGNQISQQHQNHGSKAAIYERPHLTDSALASVRNVAPEFQGQLSGGELTGVNDGWVP
jgi:hypothetical protein